MIDYKTLDPGIRDVVRLLNGHGFLTTDSGDGISKPSDERVFDVPHVVCSCTRWTMLDDADRLQSLLGSGWRIEASYCPTDKSALLLVMGKPHE